MKRLLAMASILTLGVVVGRVWPELTAHAGSRACAPGTLNGNVNGDAQSDLGDAIWLLNHLFQGGPPACDNRADLESALALCREELAACRRDLAACEQGQPLRWFTTCGDPVCGVYRGPFDGIPLCTDEREGTPCDVEGALCDIEDDCNRLLLCASQDPKAAGCPISRQRFKRDISYLSESEQDCARDELLAMKLARWRYKWDASDRKARLGFLIDDAPEAPAVDADGEHVDLYGYASMAVAAIQSQARELDTLREQMAALRAQMAELRDRR